MIINVVYGFLGAGKTSFIKYLLDHPPEGEKLVILVNEFGDVGLDGLLIGDQETPVADVVEMPSGCICCTMATDFRRQIFDLHERFSPDRMIVEPTGVATISQILSILDREDVERLYTHVELVHIIDASEFLKFVKSHRYFMESQLQASNTVVLNKIDLVKPAMLDLLISSVKEINPEANVYPANFSKIDPDILRKIFGAKSVASEKRRSEKAHHEHEADAHDHHHHDEPSLASQYSSYGKRFDAAVFDDDKLKSFFDKMKNRQFGDIVRAKGIFSTQKNRIKIELASGQIHVEPGPAGHESVVSIIGQFMNTPELENQLRICQL